MNIAIISNKSHAKSHAAALRKKGHTISMLGGNPSDIPPSADVIVCRPASISHGGFDIAMAAKRGGKRVIIANGVTEIITAVEGPPGEEEVVPRTLKNSAQALDVLSRLLGCYGSPLHDPAATQVVEALAARNGEDGLLGLKLWRKGLKACKKASVRGYAKEKGDKGADPRTRQVYSYPLRGSVRELTFFVTDAEAMGLVLSNMDLAGTRREAEKQKKKVSDRARALTAHAAPPAKKPVPPAAEPAPPAAEPAPPAKKPAPPAAEPPSWDAQLAPAIEMLLTEMRAAKVSRLTVLSDGSVNFEREVVVVTTETGSMKIEAD